MTVASFFIVLLCLCLAASITQAKEFYDLCDQAAALGYKCEHHTAVTEDGFLLDVIRFPPKTRGAYPVILQHGLLDSSITWMANYFPYQNLACILHDAGYDIWMPNSRGNHYSMKNTKYKSDSTEYWQSIDMDSMAKYDVPANIDLVLNATGHKTLSYVGHSQGCWQAFAAFGNVRRDYASKVDLYVALAPAVYIAHSTSFLIKLLAGLDVATILSIFGDKEFLSNDWLVRQITKYCAKLKMTCPSILEIFCGDGNPANLNMTQLPTILRYDPGGTSVNNMIHWQQEVKHGWWAAHDYGWIENEKIYHSLEPPKYSVKTMTAPPTAVMYGLSDALADPQDVNTILTNLPSSTLIYQEALIDYAHLDPVWGLNAHKDVYPKVLQMINKYSSKNRTMGN